MIERLRKLDEKVKDKFCQIGVDTIGLGQCTTEGEDIREQTKKFAGNYCEALKRQ